MVFNDHFSLAMLERGYPNIYKLKKFLYVIKRGVVIMASRKKTKKVVSKSVAKTGSMSKNGEVCSMKSSSFGCLSSYAFGYAVAIVSALSVLVCSVIGLLGKGAGMIDLMGVILFSYSLKPLGIIAGMAEAAIWGLIGGFLVSWLYNKFV